MKTAARRLLELVWENANDRTNFSWERLNNSMRNALSLAIGSGMDFAKDNWDLRGFNAGRWIGESLEWCYRLAVIVGNRSAIETYEAYKGRAPIIADDVDLGGDRYGGSDYSHGGGGVRKRERIVVNCSFTYHGETVKVSSFTSDGAAICCSYHPNTRKVLHRYTVTAQDIQAYRAERRERNALLDALRQQAESLQDVRDFLCVTKPGQEFSIPVKRLRAAVEKFCKSREVIP